MKSLPDLTIESEYWKKGYTVLGIDEVGRGCIAGPLTVGIACFAPCSTHAELQSLLSLGIDDSKRLTARKRTILVDHILARAIHTDTVYSSVRLINDKGIEFALRDAISKLIRKYISVYPDRKIILLVDGRAIANIPYINDIERRHIIAGDRKSLTIAAASIIAKVSRDCYMATLSGHKKYGWGQNKGYGTKAHGEAIKNYGVTSHHRTLFVRKILKAARM